MVPTWRICRDKDLIRVLRYLISPDAFIVFGQGFAPADAQLYRQQT